VNAASTWTDKSLEELVVNGDISYGIVQPGVDLPGGVPIVRVKDIRSGRIDQRSPLRVRPEFSDRYRRTLLEGGELLVSIVGTVGESAVVPKEMAGWNVARAVAVIRPFGVSADWIRLCLETSAVKHALAGVLNTTVQSTLNLADLKRLAIPLPPPAEREAIVEVLRALDDKITANAKLAESADRLVHAKFLSLARAAELSDLTFCDVSSVRGGGTPRTSIPEYWDGNINWATPTDVTGLEGLYLEGTSRRITQAGLDACASGLYPAGSILMTSRATIGAFAIAQRLTAVNQGFIVVKPHDDYLKWWLFHEMRSRVDEFVSVANGATFLELSRGNFKRFRVRLTDESVTTDFGVMAEGLHSMARERLVESSLLADLRDVLLPQLMSGSIRVKDVEKTVGEAL
jgi:type I restriction enzyme S subunit